MSRPDAASRMSLRAFAATDGDGFVELAGDFDVARMTCDIPHPIDRAMAARWLTPSAGEARWAIVAEGRLIGGAGYFVRDSGVAELGFWIGRPWWGQGFATLATHAVIRHGFETDNVPAFSASHFVDNPASGRVLAKLGFVVMGEGRQWSVARSADVAAVSCWLDRDRFESVTAIRSLA